MAAGEDVPALNIFAFEPKALGESHPQLLISRRRPAGEVIHDLFAFDVDHPAQDVGAGGLLVRLHENGACAEDHRIVPVRVHVLRPQLEVAPLQLARDEIGVQRRGLRVLLLLLPLQFADEVRSAQRRILQVFRPERWMIHVSSTTHLSVGRAMAQHGFLMLSAREIVREGDRLCQVEWGHAQANRASSTPSSNSK